MRNRNSKRVLAVATVTALLSGVGVAAFAVDDTKEVRQSDIIKGLSACSDASACDDVRTNGEYQFLEEGLHAVTTDAANPSSRENKVALYFAPRGGSALPDSASQDWYGTKPAPGMQIIFDYDGTPDNGNDYNILVGEAAYGDDWWLTNSSSDDAKAADPSGSENGGSGSDYFGTLAEWKAAMPNAKVQAYGFSLGSGVKGDGVLRSQTYGGDEYIFTDEAETAAAVEPEQHTKERDVTATGSWNNANRVARFTMNSSDIPNDDTGRGDKVKWEIFVGGTRVYVSNNGWDDTTTWTWKFSTAGGSQKVEVKRNGASYKTSYITTR